MPDFTAAQQNQAATITGAGMPSLEANAVVTAIKELAQTNPVITGTLTADEVIARKVTGTSTVSTPTVASVNGDLVFQTVTTTSTTARGAFNDTTGQLRVNRGFHITQSVLTAPNTGFWADYTSGFRANAAVGGYSFTVGTSGGPHVTITTAGTGTSATLVLTGISTATTGLTSGMLYSDAGTIKIMP